MRAFEYASPTTTEDVVRLLGDDGAAVLAGGTDLLSLMKADVARPIRLVNIKRVEALHGIASNESGLRIGATTTLAELVESEEVKVSCPSLVQAAEGIASPQILNMGTVGGELCQRPRCWYYRAGFGLLAQRDGTSMVPAGDNRYHAVLGNDGPAYFVSPSSLAPPLIALGARLHIQGGDGEREVSLEDFYRTPGAEGQLEYDLERGEVVTAIVVPRHEGRRDAAYEVRPRKALDWPLAAAAVALDIEGETIAAARVVLGHVAPTPWLAATAAEHLVGKSLSAPLAEEVAAKAIEGARPLSRNAYKVPLARTAAKRALLRAAGMEV